MSYGLFRWIEKLIDNHFIKSMMLEKEFHSVKRIPENVFSMLAWLPFPMVSWIYSLNLTQYNKCVFLNPNFLVIEILPILNVTRLLLFPRSFFNFAQVLKNSDELFRSGTWVENTACCARRLQTHLPGSSTFILVQNPGGVAYQRLYDIATISDRG
jgi:hypothetical protein